MRRLLLLFFNKNVKLWDGFDRARRMSSLTSNLFRCFVLIARRAENPDSQRKLVAKGIRATMALSTRRG